MEVGRVCIKVAEDGGVENTSIYFPNDNNEADPKAIVDKISPITEGCGDCELLESCGLGKIYFENIRALEDQA